MNPWLAHLDNLDLQWIVDAGIPHWYDAGIDVWLNAQFFVLRGQLQREDQWAHPGALLGLESWMVRWPSHAAWTVSTSVMGLLLPLRDAHRVRWAQALSVALAAEGRQRNRMDPLADETEAVALKFRYITSRLGWLEEDSNRVK